MPYWQKTVPTLFRDGTALLTDWVWLFMSRCDISLAQPEERPTL